MAEAAVDTPSPDVRSRARNPARRALLDAARRIVNQQGIAGVSLTAVAEEAGFARATAYAHFRGKDDLLQSIVAEDLTILVRAIRICAGLPEPSPHPAPPSRVVRVDFQSMRPASAVVEKNSRKTAEAFELLASCEVDLEASLVEPADEPAAARSEADQTDWPIAQRDAPDAIVSAGSSDSSDAYELTEQQHVADDVVPTEESEAGVELAPQDLSEPEDLTEQLHVADQVAAADELREAGDEPAPQNLDEAIGAVNRFEPDELELVDEPGPDAEPTEDEAAGASFAASFSVPETSEDNVGSRTDEQSSLLAFDEPDVDDAIESEQKTDTVLEDAVGHAAPQEAEESGTALSLDPVTSDLRDEIVSEATNTEPSDQPAPVTAKPLAPRLPSREDRLALTSKRALATSALRDTLKRLAPMDPTDAESPSDAVARLEKIVARVDPDHVARLERRLVVLERNVAGLEERATQTIAKKSGAEENAKVELTNVVQRLESFEKRQRGMVLKMMAEIRDSSRRLDALEAAKREAARRHNEFLPADSDANIHPEPVETDLALVSQELERVFADARAMPENGEAQESDTFLDNARRAALSAVTTQLEAELAQEDAKRRSRRNRLLVGGIVLAALVLGGSAIALRDVVSNEPVVRVALHERDKSHTTPSATNQVRGLSAPIDRLSALARAGNPDAELTVGLKYLEGKGVSKNESEGAAWVARAAVKGDTLAQYQLAILYEHGRGVVADPMQAFVWNQKAAIAGNRKAMHNLAVAYAQGKGVAANMAESARWFSKAASLGYVDSAFNLAVLYERGDGVPQSLIDAYKWYAIAANEGDSESKTRMSAMESELSPDALAAAQKAASAFKPSSPTASSGKVTSASTR